MNRPRAFSLIEVLIAVLILALGLLGLGAIFPVVIKQQRQSTDATIGLTAASAAKLELINNASLRGEPPVLPTGGTGPMESGVPPLQSWYTYLTAPSRRNELFSPEIDPDTGAAEVGAAGGAPAIIPLAARLFPAPHSGSQPRYVWDIMAQYGGTDAIDVFIFVRAVDPNIRVTPGQTLSDTLAPLNAAGDLLDPTALAVAVDSTTGMPTFNGRGEYSEPASLDVASLAYNDTDTDRSNDRNRLMFEATSADERAMANLARRVNQRLVDGRGNVYTVKGIPKSESSEYTVLIDPPVPADVLNASELDKVYFTPQIPVSVTKVKIKI
jgi:prepilin-type N-terminal cleavage/methylation domain-containing protein